MTRIFSDRYDAGQQLAEALTAYADRDDVVVLGLPRGGIPVAFEVARGLNAPLDVFVVRKLGVPMHDEMAMGAIASGGVRVLNQEIVRSLRIDETTINNVAEKEQRELERRASLYRGDHPIVELHGKIVLLVDDGMATGATMRAAVRAITQYQPSKLIIAVPTASRQTCDEFRRMDEVDDIHCILTPRSFRAVGRWYKVFDQTRDDEVRHLLDQSRERA